MLRVPIIGARITKAVVSRAAVSCGNDYGLFKFILQVIENREKSERVLLFAFVNRKAVLSWAVNKLERGASLPFNDTWGVERRSFALEVLLGNRREAPFLASPWVEGRCFFLRSGESQKVLLFLLIQAHAVSLFGEVLSRTREEKEKKEEISLAGHAHER